MKYVLVSLDNDAANLLEIIDDALDDASRAACTNNDKKWDWTLYDLPSAILKLRELEKAENAYYHDKVRSQENCPCCNPQYDQPVLSVVPMQPEIQPFNPEVRRSAEIEELYRQAHKEK